MRKFMAFVLICAYIMGTVGGFLCLVVNGAYVPAIAVLMLAYMAWDRLLEERDILLDGNYE